MKAGEEKTFPLTFPENYGLQSLNGKTAEFEVKVTEVAEPKYPEVDEEFAKSLGVEGGVEALRAEGVKTETGEFGEHMRVSLLNDGPATFLLDYRAQ